MSPSAPKRSVEDTLTTISALRRLCLTLPHAQTPEEVRRLDRFERLRRGRASLSDGDIDALRTGLRHCWRSQETGTLLEMAARIPPELLQRDRWLQSFVVAARERSRSTPRG
jgi:hypothetical protein